MRIFSPILGFLTSLTLVYFLLEYIPPIETIGFLIPLGTSTTYHLIQGLEIRVLFLLEEILLVTNIATTGNVTLYYLCWGLGGLVAGILARHPKIGFITGLLSVILGIGIYWIYRWIIIHGLNPLLMFHVRTIC